jgi:nucleotide-binding universal stress UspA family protein
MSSPKPEQPAIRQILVAMDVLSDNLAVLESAAELAAQLEAELTGLFVEDTDLLRAAELPVSLEVMLWSARERNPTETEMARALRALAARIQKDLERAAKRARVRWSFKVVRGPRLQVFMEAGAGSDLMFVGPARCSRVPRYSPQRPPKRLGAVCVLYSGTEAAQRALTAAMKLADQDRVQVKVLLAGTDVKDIRSTESGLDERLKDPRLAVRFLDLRAGENDQVLIDLLGKMEPGALIVPADNRLTQDPLLFQRLQTAVNCPIMFVR